MEVQTASAYRRRRVFLHRRAALKCRFQKRNLQLLVPLWPRASQQETQIAATRLAKHSTTLVRALPFAASFFLWLADKTRVALPGANAASGDGFVLVGVAATASNASMDNDTSKQGSNWTRPRQDKEHTCVAMSCSARRGTTAQPTITQRVVARLWSYRDRRLMACIAHHDVAQLATKNVRDDGVAARVTDLAAQV